MEEIQSLPANISTIISKDNKICAGKDCSQTGKRLLRIILINKTGYFCDNCSKDLINLELVEKP